MAKSFTLPADADVRPATPKQRAYLARLEHKTNFGEEITMAQCAARIAAAKGETVTPNLGRREALAHLVTEKPRFQALWDTACAAGLAAGNARIPTPITVCDTVIADGRGQRFRVPEGLCGFAWVIVKPGTSRFARWLKENDHARSDSYYGGVCIWIGAHGQSMERKEAHANALAKVLQEAGINAVSMSRLD